MQNLRHFYLNVHVFLQSSASWIWWMHLLLCFSVCLVWNIEFKSKLNGTMKSWRNFFRSIPPRLGKAGILCFWFLIWYNFSTAFIQPPMSVVVWLTDLTQKCVQPGQLTSHWFGDISQLAVISWLKGDPRLQVLLPIYGADRSEALLDLRSPGKEAKKKLQIYM